MFSVTALQKPVHNNIPIQIHIDRWMIKLSVGLFHRYIGIHKYCAVIYIFIFVCLSGIFQALKKI